MGWTGKTSLLFKIPQSGCPRLLTFDFPLHKSGVGVILNMKMLKDIKEALFSWSCHRQRFCCLESFRCCNFLFLTQKGERNLQQLSQKDNFLGNRFSMSIYFYHFYHALLNLTKLESFITSKQSRQKTIFKNYTIQFKDFCYSTTEKMYHFYPKVNNQWNWCFWYQNDWLISYFLSRFSSQPWSPFPRHREIENWK